MRNKLPSKSLPTILLLLLMLALLGSTAWAEPPVTDANVIGSVRTVAGKAQILRGDKTLEAAVGEHLYVDDILRTASDGTLGVTFRDDTMLSLGPSSQLKIDAFVFEPAKDHLSFIADMQSGTAQFISGQMAKIAPEKMSVRTPFATIGIRGTRFLVKVD